MQGKLYIIDRLALAAIAALAAGAAMSAQTESFSRLPTCGSREGR